MTVFHFWKILENEKVNDDDQDDWLEYLTVQDLQEITDEKLKNSKIKVNNNIIIRKIFNG